MAHMKLVDLMLYAGDAWSSVDLDEKTSFPFNLQASDLTDPTATKIPFSAQVKLPKTGNNDDIFSLIGQYDSRALKINPLTRTDFRLYVGGNIYQTGYMKIENITPSGYNIRLYGGLGDYFYTMSEKKLSDLGYEAGGTTQNAYGKKYEHTVNCQQVANSFRGMAIQNTSGQNMSSFFGYTMTYQGAYDNFDSDSEAVTVSDVDEATWISRLNKKYSQPELNEHRRSYRLDGADSGDVYCGEYRSYYQRPRLKLSDLYDRILEYMAEQGWTTHKDETFFNANNPYWNDTWVICPQYNVTNGDVSPSGKEFTWGSLPALTPWDGEKISSERRSWDLGTISDLTDGAITTDTDTLFLTVKLPILLQVAWNMGNSDVENRPRGFTIIPTITIDGIPESYPMTWKGNNAKVIAVNETNIRKQRVKEIRSFFLNTKSSGSGALASDQMGLDYATVFDLECTITLNPGTYNPYKSITAVFTGSGNTHWVHGDKNPQDKPASLQVIPGFRKDAPMGVTVSQSDSKALRSGTTISFRDIVSSDDSCFDFLRSYNKIFGLYYVKDTASKTVYMLTRNSYFGLQERRDWTGKIDYSKEVSTGTITLDYRYGIFSWQNQGTKYEEKYLADFSREYGSVVFDTNYEFTDAQKNLMDGVLFGNLVPAVDYSQYYLGRSGTMFKDNKMLPHLATGGGDKVDTAYILCFVDGVRSVTNGNFRVTDDLPIMYEYGYCWNSTSTNSVAVSQYPNVVRTIGSNDKQSSLNFGMPRVAYDDTNNFGEQTTAGIDSLYIRFWQSYIRDIHDINTKIVTVYVYLTLADVYEDLFNKFIFIDNTPFVVQKVHNYDPTQHTATKVDLISVQDIGSYLGQQYVAGNLTLTYGGTMIYDHSGDTAGVQSASPVVIRVQATNTEVILSVNCTLGWKIGDHANELTINPLEAATAGTRSLSIRMPGNTAGSAVSYVVPIRWGNTTTLVQIMQVSNWTVSVSANVGTATVNGEPGPIQIPDSQSVAFNTTGAAGYTFGYWRITNNNGLNSYYGQSISLSITSDTEAEAVWLDSSTIGWQTSGFDMTEYGGDVTNHLKVPNGLSFTVSADTGAVFQPEAGINSTDVVFTIPENTARTPPRTITGKAVFNNNVESLFTVSQEAAKYVDIDRTSQRVSGSAQRISLTVDSNTSWTATGDGLTLTPASGTGPATVYIDIPLNKAVSEVAYRVVLATTNGADSKTFTITQEVFIPTLSLNPLTTTVNGQANSYTVTVTSNTGWTIDIAAASTSYLSVSPGTGTGNGSTLVTVAENASVDSRIGEAVFRTTHGNLDQSVVHEVTQTAGRSSAYVQLQNATGTAVTLASPVTLRVSNSGGTVVGQQEISTIAAGNTRFDFENLPLGSYTISLTAYTGTTSDSRTWTASPAASQSVQASSGVQNGVSYAFTLT